MWEIMIVTVLFIGIVLFPTGVIWCIFVANVATGLKLVLSGVFLIFYSIFLYVSSSDKVDW